MTVSGGRTCGHSIKKGLGIASHDLFHSLSKPLCLCAHYFLAVFCISHPHLCLHLLLRLLSGHLLMVFIFKARNATHCHATFYLRCQKLFLQSFCFCVLQSILVFLFNFLAVCRYFHLVQGCSFWDMTLCSLVDGYQHSFVSTFLQNVGNHLSDCMVSTSGKRLIQY